MGVLQALEVVKLISAGKLTATEGEKAGEASMLLFSANSNPPFRSVKLRARTLGCFACSAEAGLSLESLTSGSLNYALFCGVTTPIQILEPEERIEAKEYQRIKREREIKEHLLIDVREKVQFDICNIDGSINVPFSTLQGNRPVDRERPRWIPEDLPPDAPLYIICRLGNDSQVVARRLKESGFDNDGRYIGDIKDGLKGWKEQVDSSWPEY
jgi:adenylyltransferase/sulfurtransferase